MARTRKGKRDQANSETTQGEFRPLDLSIMGWGSSEERRV